MRGKEPFVARERIGIDKRCRIAKIERIGRGDQILLVAAVVAGGGSALAEKTVTYRRFFVKGTPYAESAISDSNAPLAAADVDLAAADIDLAAADIDLAAADVDLAVADVGDATDASDVADTDSHLGDDSYCDSDSYSWTWPGTGTDRLIIYCAVRPCGACSGRG